MAVTSGSFTWTTSNEFINAKISWQKNGEPNVTNNTTPIKVTLSFSRTNTGYTTQRKWSGKIICGSQYKTSSTSTTYEITYNSNTVVQTATFDVPHNSDGSLTVAIGASGTLTGGTKNYSVPQKTQSFTLPDIARATTATLSSSNVEIGQTITITLPKAVETFTHNVKYSYGDLNGDIASNIDSSCTWTLPMNLCNQTPNETSGWGNIIVDTYNGTALVGTRYTRFDATIPSTVIPSVSNLSYVLDNGTNEIISGWNVAIAGYTKVRLTASAEGIYGSTINGFSISNGYSTNINSSSLNYTGSIIEFSGNKTFTVCSKDSRGRKSNPSSVTIKFYQYSKPVIKSFSVKRSESNSKKIVISCDWDYSSVNNKNTVTTVLKYKKHSSSSWATYSGTINKNTDTTLSTDFSDAYSYDFSFSIVDAIGGSDSTTGFVSTLAVFLNFRAGGKGLGIGKMCEKDALECTMDAEFTGSFSADLSGLLVKKTFTATSKSIAANVVADTIFNISYSGYTPIGIVGSHSSNGGLALIVSQLTSSTEAKLTVRNVTSSSITYAPIIDVLYIKNIQV